MKSKSYLKIGVLFFSVFYLIGCSNSTDPGPISTAGNVSMSVVYTTQAVSGLQKSGAVNAVDSVKLTRVRVILRNLKLKSENNEEVEMEHKDGMMEDHNSTQKLAPFVLDLNLSGLMQQLSVSNVPFGTYDRLKFQIHKVSQSEIDSLPAPLKDAFVDFLNGDRYSIIIDGTIYKNGQATPFTYKSKINVEIEKTLSPKLVIDQSNSTLNITLQVSSAEWFYNNGSLLDPSDPNNFSLIEHNLKSFLKAFKDNNKDGHEDNN